MLGKGLRGGRIPRVSADGRPYPPPLLHRCCQIASAGTFLEVQSPVESRARKT
jgi:hypothetical protein